MISKLVSLLSSECIFPQRVPPWCPNTTLLAGARIWKPKPLIWNCEKLLLEKPWQCVRNWVCGVCETIAKLCFGLEEVFLMKEMQSCCCSPLHGAVRLKLLQLSTQTPPLCCLGVWKGKEVKCPQVITAVWMDYLSSGSPPRQSTPPLHVW